jgi:hypothetical protein
MLWKWAAGEDSARVGVDPSTKRLDRGDGRERGEK